MRTYYRNRLPGSKSPLIALLLSTSNAYGRAIFKGVMDYVAKHGPWRLLAETQCDSGVDLPPADGLLLGVCSNHTVDQLRKYEGPAILMSGRTQVKGVPIVRSNDRVIGQMGAQHLIGLGLKNLCFVSEEGPMAMTGRLEGFAAEAKKAGAHVSFLVNPMERSGSQRKAFQDSLTRLPKPVGLMAMTDLVGCSVMRSGWEAGIRIPEDMAVLGVQNDELLCASCVPPMSSIGTGAERIGFEAARLLDLWLKGHGKPIPITEIEPTGVIRRQSTDTIALADPRLAKAVAYIRIHAMDPCNVNDVVKHVGGGRRHLEVKFREIFNRTPHDEIQRIRIEGVQHLLQDTDLTIEDIAARCGFGYLPNLVRAFRQSCGCTPSEYRKRMR